MEDDDVDDEVDSDIVVIDDVDVDVDSDKEAVWRENKIKK